MFEKGIANGPAHFVLPDGSYYHGNMENNKAETLHGEFRTGSNYVYEGGFKNNKFHGAGTEKGNGYTFDGNFSEGRRMHGTLKWEEKNEDENGLIVIKEYVYKGNFD